jgi:hypothetical protein
MIGGIGGAMKRQWLDIGGLLVCATCLVLLMAVANKMENTRKLKELQETISNVRKMSGPIKPGANAAEHLAQLTEKIDPKKIDDKTLGDLVSLLDTSNDFVRAWVAAALRHLGPRAKGAVPALLKVMHETDCLELREMTSAGAVRVALRRIGVTPPPPDCGKKGQ